MKKMLEMSQKTVVAVRTFCKLMVRNLHATTWCFAGAVQGKMNTASHQLFLSACLDHRGDALKWKQKQMESVTPFASHT